MWSEFNGHIVLVLCLVNDLDALFHEVSPSRHESSSSVKVLGQPISEHRLHIAKLKNWTAQG
jgi:hypothetical protein